jgi:hypothetical protein
MILKSELKLTLLIWITWFKIYSFFIKNYSYTTSYKITSKIEILLKFCLLFSCELLKENKCFKCAMLSKNDMYFPAIIQML